MGMRAGLSVGVNARTGVLDHIRGRAQLAVRQDREHCHAAACVIGDQREPTAALDAHIAGIASMRRLFIQQADFISIYRKSTYTAIIPSLIILKLIDRVKKITLRMQCKIRRIENSFDFPREKEFPGRWIHFINIEPLAAAPFVFSISPDKYKG